eukprot:8204989-Karenia_brevis.AAC.1
MPTTWLPRAPQICALEGCVQLKSANMVRATERMLMTLMTAMTIQIVYKRTMIVMTLMIIRVLAAHIAYRSKIP